MKLVPNANQPRKYFEEEKLAQLGGIDGTEGDILQPILVRKTNGKYRIVAGERRFRAAEKLGLEQVPAMVVGESERSGSAGGVDCREPAAR